MKCLKVKTSNNIAFLEYMNFLTEKEVHWGKDRYDIVIPPYLLRNYNSQEDDAYKVQLKTTAKYVDSPLFFLLYCLTAFKKVNFTQYKNT